VQICSILLWNCLRQQSSFPPSPVSERPVELSLKMHLVQLNIYSAELFPVILPFTCFFLSVFFKRGGWLRGIDGLTESLFWVMISHDRNTFSCKSQFFTGRGGKQGCLTQNYQVNLFSFAMCIAVPSLVHGGSHGRGKQGLCVLNPDV